MMSGDSTSKTKIKPLKIVIWSILGTVLLFVCIVLGSLLVQKYIKKTRVPMFAGYASLVVTTGSMSDTINQGDLIFIKKTDNYARMDVVTFVKNGEVITHRIVYYYDPVTKEATAEYTGWFITKGDANTDTDEIYAGAISEEEIIGEWVGTIPKVGIILEWFSHEGGIIYVIALIVIAVAGVYLWGAMKPEEEAAAEGETPAEELSAEQTEEGNDDASSALRAPSPQGEGSSPPFSQENTETPEDN